MCLNINGLLNKKHELHYIASSSNFSVIEITETKLDNTVYDYEVALQVYCRNFEVIETETVEASLVMLEIIFVITRRLISLLVEKIFTLIFFIQK